MNIEKNEYRKKILVCPTDTDSYNIIHHPRYLVWIEEAILEWLITAYGSLEQVSYEICKFQCKFISPGFLYDKLVLQLILKSRKRSENDENLTFQVRIMKAHSKNSMIEAVYSVKVKGNFDD